MYPDLNEDAVFERLESLRREVESSRLMAQGLGGWVRVIRNLGARAWPRRRPAPAQHAYEETTASDAA